jgi:hypothetical protein
MLGASGNAFSKGRDFAAMKLKRMPMPHSMFHGNACFAYFKKIWDIALECTRY